MKKISLILVFITLSVHYMFAQELRAPAEGKALIVFTRPALDAPIIKFSYFDDDRFIGKIGAGSYVAYECDPGKHIFWGKSENRDFLEADLEANQTYIVETRITTGLLKARIDLVPYSPKMKNAEKFKERILKRIAKRKEVSAEEITDAEDAKDALKATIEKGLAEYQKRKDKGKKIDVLTSDMHI